MVYTKRSDGYYFVFEGMTEDQISKMWAGDGFTCEVIDAGTYREATAATH